MFKSKREVLSLLVLVAIVAILAVGCGLSGSLAQAPQYTPTPTKTPKPTFTPTPEVTPTPTPTNTPVATPTPVPTDTPEATPTPEPTNTPVPPPPTNTPRPRPTSPPQPTNTPAPPPPTPTPSLPYIGQVVQTFTNCGLTQVFGVVLDKNGNPKRGVTIRGWWEGGPILITEAGKYVRPETNEAGWDFTVNNKPVPLVFRVEVYRKEDGARLSNTVTITTVGTCNPGDINVAKVVFREN